MGLHKGTVWGCVGVKCGASQGRNVGLHRGAKEGCQRAQCGAAGGRIV